MPDKLGNLSIYTFGERGSNTEDLKQTCGQQKYDEIQTNLKVTRQLFQDPEFEPSKMLLTKSMRRRVTINWLRPNEIEPNPKFEVNGFTRFDLQQGDIGDCWILAAAASLTLNAERFHMVVPSNQTFTGPNYTGCFRFRLWYFGSWVEMVVDDRLPCDSKNHLLVVQSSTSHEFWPALLEKAFAKLSGGYGHIEKGYASDALISLTGGISERLNLRDITTLRLWEILQQVSCSKVLITASIEDDAGELEEVLENGLVVLHVYTVTQQSIVMRGGKQTRLVRLRNPWGRQEWSGDWSDNSRLWKKICKEDLENTGYLVREDGEFWMSLTDLKSNFHELELTHIQEKYSKVRTIFSEWISGMNAGGCSNHATFTKNPVFLFYISDRKSMMVSLMQLTRRVRKENDFAIGFCVIKVPEEDVRRGVFRDIKLLPDRHESVSLGDIKLSAALAGIDPVYSCTHAYQGEVSLRVSLEQGLYAIIPSTWLPRKSRKFLLRVLQTSD